MRDKTSNFTLTSLKVSESFIHLKMLSEFSFVILINRLLVLSLSNSRMIFLLQKGIKYKFCVHPTLRRSGDALSPLTESDFVYFQFNGNKTTSI